ncbi:Holliday junction DNA helicase subunit RuvA [Sporobacter termitidis DSM 10068]|uniref:Holliday junction branch migration complex subunit RuvA n=1 Tax=Sporobacter termitidis DSM 10068 TaxID=1123282 RepID=A0A1M5UGK7_9FIRM|nr:Holliday junction branch migration protein RuvA [Sporobacter termitidis]SHH62097.1 Holliday junction DNA helicase subunit RuvA [Sporobacter termitidis DSM 10068]
MFYYLEGVVTIIEQNLAVMDAGGAGYACYTTAHTLSRLEIGKKARLYTYCNIKEDAFDIFGFYDMSEKRFFEQLLTVSGVGPKAALSILSAGTPETLAVAIVAGDERMLTLAPGIGKKLAQRVILELKDKVAKESAGLKGQDFIPVPAGAEAAGSKLSDAQAALAVLGYSPAEIATALRGMELDALTVEEIIRSVLKSSLK